jgi:hypothetical protein
VVVEVDEQLLQLVLAGVLRDVAVHLAALDLRPIL